jgi:peptidoglycan-associated lipoprotein
MINTKNVALLLIMMSIVGCSKKKVTINNTGYNITVEEQGFFLQEDFNNKAGNKVYFTFDKSHISKEAKSILIKQAKWLKDNPATSVVIEGHSDEIGTSEYNIALSLKRAKAVKNFLVEKGINESRLNITSYGKSMLENLAHTKEANRLNRRAVTILVYTNNKK